MNDLPPPVYIGFSTPKKFNPVSWIVRKLTGSRCSHAWIMFHGATLGINVVIEAHEFGFRLIPYERFKAKNNIVAMVNPIWPMKEVIQFQAKWLGTNYDFGGLIGSAWVLLGRLFRMEWRNPFQNKRAMFCSESIVHALQEAEYPKSKELVPDNTSPQDLLNFFEEGHTKIVYDAI